MAVFVLIHGMWHGGWCWKKVRRLLLASGHEVHVATLTGVGERAHLRYLDIDMNTHVQDVIGILEYEELQDVILVGHSLGGFMAPAVAERVPERIAHIVSLDGARAAEGKAFKDYMPDHFDIFRQRGLANGDEWWTPPALEWTFGVTGADLEWMQSKLTPHPLKTWLMPMSFSNPSARSIPRTFILCTEGWSPEGIANEQKECLESGWQFCQLATGHDAMITAPKELSDLLVDLI